MNRIETVPEELYLLQQLFRSSESSTAVRRRSGGFSQATHLPAGREKYVTFVSLSGCDVEVSGCPRCTRATAKFLQFLWQGTEFNLTVTGFLIPLWFSVPSRQFYSQLHIQRLYSAESLVFLN